ncbi:uncharacterized protein PHACADRAFT_248399 [Phanerochaete carnosa HHB-10118-sp]|uniref:Uncharacterized protein n=1 Tax=Phanerochaete carnosa (strain HHB-10118-sp) TaxID=650164 RepID=K5XEZ5_PHACS|nr:uncharacterized protein PHACADRAFT_248399 [Phanerochaete carnosa HHB-10118-sp]EKM61662.1 hypothetical protein PHACADRAFT_248399 [Phanerochaete carnosa HHB-10118-sp]
MSAMRVHRLRALAVQKLAAAYRADEIASSVMVMQGGSVFDDIAERVLRADPNDIDARYVHFFHERIPSSPRQLAQSTSTTVLDSLIAAQPHRLEFFRTRGTVHCFRDEFAPAIKDFTHVLREARAQRKARMMHRTNGISSEQRGRGKKKRGKQANSRTNGQAPANGTSTPPEGPTIDGPDGEPLLLHPSVLPDAPDPIEPQCLFLRGAAYLQHAVCLIEQAILELEGIKKELTPEGAELRLCYLDGGRYGGVEIGNPDGPLGSKDGVKLKAYREVLTNEGIKEQVLGLVKKSIRDHERFLSHFDTLEGAPIDPADDVDWSTKVEHAFLLSQSYRPGSPNPPPPPLHPDAPVMFTTYHPLLVESHFSILIGQILLGDFPSLVPSFYRSAMLVDGLEGYPIFLPPRSMAQAEFIEILERLAGGWRTGVQPHSFMRSSSLALELHSRSAKAKTKEAERPLMIIAPEPISACTSSSLSTLVLGVNGSSSSTAVHPPSPSSGRATPPRGVDLAESLDFARMLLVPVARAQKERDEKVEAEKAAERMAGKAAKKPLSINIPLHGPRVEVAMAWLGAVHLPDLESVA